MFFTSTNQSRNFTINSATSVGNTTSSPYQTQQHTPPQQSTSHTNNNYQQQPFLPNTTNHSIHTNNNYHCQQQHGYMHMYPYRTQHQMQPIVQNYTHTPSNEILPQQLCIPQSGTYEHVETRHPTTQIITGHNHESNSPNSMESMNGANVSHTTESYSPNMYKNKRTNRACISCRQAHKKCNEERPCSRCIACGKADKCVDFETGRKRGRKANMPRSGGLLVHNYDPQKPFVSGKPNMIVFSLQHIIREDPGIVTKQTKTKKLHQHVNPSISDSTIAHPSTSSISHQATFNASVSPESSLPSITEFMECKKVLSNSNSVFSTD